MTVKELYEWAAKNNATGLDIEIQYRDAGGDYDGRDELCVDYIYIDYGYNDNSTSKVVVL